MNECTNRYSVWYYTCVVYIKVFIREIYMCVSTIYILPHPHTHWQLLYLYNKIHNVFDVCIHSVSLLFLSLQLNEKAELFIYGEMIFLSSFVWYDSNRRSLLGLNFRKATNPTIAKEIEVYTWCDYIHPNASPHISVGYQLWLFYLSACRLSKYIRTYIR